MAGTSRPYHYFTSDKIAILLDDSDNDTVESGSAKLEVKLTMHRENLSLQTNTEPVTVTAPDSDAPWVLRDINAGYRAQTIPSSGPHGPLITFIVQKTKRYAEKFIQGCTLKPRSRVKTGSL
jgi:hypothetical protein